MQKTRTRGHAAIELGLILPWLVISFIGAFDLGFANYSLISAESGARAAAMWGAVSSTNATNMATTACNYALDAFRYAPGVGSGATTCSGSVPVRVATSTLAAASSGDKTCPAVSVTVTYTVSMIPFPGLFPSSMAVSRTVQLPIRN